MDSQSSLSGVFISFVSSAASYVMARGGSCLHLLLLPLILLLLLPFISLLLHSSSFSFLLFYSSPIFLFSSIPHYSTSSFDFLVPSPLPLPPCFLSSRFLLPLLPLPFLLLPFCPIFFLHFPFFFFAALLMIKLLIALVAFPHFSSFFKSIQFNSNSFIV